jgi:hypothetical protein
VPEPICLPTSLQMAGLDEDTGEVLEAGLPPF